MKILVFGKRGQVGGEATPRLAAVGDVIACDQHDANFEHPDKVATLVLRERPDVIVNAAAYTAVDRAESEPDLARLVNADSVAAVAAEAKKLGSLLVHYSTDYVFDGLKDGLYLETDPPNPLSVYGRTKLDGERAITASGCHHWIFRTSWVYAARGHNFVRTMLRLGRERDQLRVVDDQYGAPTSATLLADVTTEFIQRLGGQSRPADGIYHLVPHGETTWCWFARFILATAQANGEDVRCPPDRVEAISTADYPTPARRPANSRLCTAKIEAALGRRLPEWQDGVASVAAAIVAEGKV